MDELKAHYRKALPSRIAALASAREAADEEAMATIRRIAHALRGSGGTFGFPRITSAAAAVEDAAEDDLLQATDRLVAVLQEAAGSDQAARARILVVEDDPTSAVIMEGALETASREIVIAASVAEAEAALEPGDISLVVLDLVLPDGDGRNLLMRLRDRSETAAVPVIVVSGRMGPRPKAECFALGADIFLEKPFDPEVLQAAVSAKLQRTALVARDTPHDDLTGRPNRAALREAYERKRQEAGALAVALLNMDHFMRVVESRGGDSADAVLVRVAEVIADTLRPDDILGRWGGEEFVALLPGVDVGEAVRLVDGARRALRGSPMEAGNGPITVTFSAGVVAADAVVQFDEAVSAAGRYLYIAKSTGRNKVVGETSDDAPPQRTIVVAEDDPLVASMLKHRMHKEGFEVIHFANGAELVEAADTLDPSLAILDVKMPGMDGFEVLEHLRQTETFGGVPIIMLTSMGAERDIVRGFDLGANDYVLKPFSPVELVARVHRLMEKR